MYNNRYFTDEKNNVLCHSAISGKATKGSVLQHNALIRLLKWNSYLKRNSHHALFILLLLIIPLK